MHYRQLLSAIAQAHTSAVGRAAAAINQGLVLRNWLVGAYVVEFEQGGEDRAKYGESLMPRHAKDLTKRKLPGLGLSTLKNCRLFYQTYPQISQPLVGQLEALSISSPVVRKLPSRVPATAGLSQKLFVSRYLVAPPSVAQLKKFVEADRARLVRHQS